MPHPLKHLLAAVRRRARLGLVIYGIAWVVAIALAAGLALGSLDCALRSDDVVVRLLCCGLWWLGLAAATYRFLYPAVAARLSDVQLAQRVQRRWPDLGDRLSSAVEFVDQAEDDALAGSPDLRRTVIADAEARAGNFPLPEAVDFRRPLWASFVAAGLAGMVVTLSCVAPAATCLAARRLMLPLTKQSWPRTHRLAFVRPPGQLASGEDLYVELYDENGKLPDEVKIQFRAAGSDGAADESQPMDYDHNRERMVYRLKNVTQSFDFRATGGDDDTMNWHRLDVIQPPRIESLDITVHPPDYTGWSQETSDRSIFALAGTSLQLRGKATKPLMGANLVLETSAGRTELAARLGDDQKTFKVPADTNHPWLVEESGVYGFQLIDRYQPISTDEVRQHYLGKLLDVLNPPDRQRLKIILPVFQRASGGRARVSDCLQRLHRDRKAKDTQADFDAFCTRFNRSLKNAGLWLELAVDSRTGAAAEQRFCWFEGPSPTPIHTAELRAVADRPPTISLDRPAASTYVTADALVGMEALVKDDLLVRSIDLVFHHKTDDDEREQIISLYERTAGPPRGSSSPLSAGGPLEDNLQVTYEWDLSQLEGIKPGDMIEFHLAATDYKPQSNACTKRRLTVISADELAERIAQRQTFILGQLAAAIDAQLDARSQTKALSIQLDEVGGFDAQDINHLQSAELNQRRVEQLLVDDREGLTRELEDLLADVANNRLDSPDISRRMQELLDEIRRVGAEHLTVIRQQLISAIKVSQAGRRDGDDPRSKELKKSLVDAGRQQDQVIDKLERLRSQLAKWDSYRRFAREISQLRRDQQALTKETAEKQLATVGRDFQELDATDRARLRRLGEHQFELARRLERILSRMEQMQLQLVDADPLAAETIGDAVDVARRHAIAEQMRIAGRDVETNRLGQAAQAHALIDQALEELLDVLAGRRAHELGRLIRMLHEATAEVDEALGTTKGLIKKLRQTEESTRGLPAQERRRQLERLVAEQQRLQQRVERLARQLKRLQAERAGQSAGQSAQRLSDACQAGLRGDAKSALEHTEGAQKDLEHAAGQLKERIGQLEQDLFRERLARLDQQVTALRERQQAVLDETIRLRELQLQQERLTRGQAESVRDLAREQRALSDEARAFGQSIAEAIVFHAALDGAADHMNRSSARLARRLLDHPTQQVQRNAIKRLDDLLEALKPDTGGEPQDPNGGAGQSNRGGAGRISSLAELKLLKMLQEDVHRRTVEFQEARQRRGDALTDEMMMELTALAKEQGRIAKLMLDLSEPVDAPPEDAPDDLPDPREDALPDLDAELQQSLPGTLPGG